MTPARRLSRQGLRAAVAAVAFIVAVTAPITGIGEVWAQTAEAPTGTTPQETTGGTPKSGTTQTPSPPTTGGALSKSTTAPTVPAKTGKSISVMPADSNAPDYVAWENLATRAETTISDRATSNAGLELLRNQLVDWRAALLGAQSTNSNRIANLRTQIAALGAAPAEGQTEAAELAERRKKLTDQLVRLQAPGIAADEAYRRADGLISEIDRVMRERQAEELLRLWPSPINPANWPVAISGISGKAVALWSEYRTVSARADARREIGDNLPLILALLLFSVALIWRGRRWIEQFTLRLQENASARGRKLWALLASLGQIIIPMLGVVALSVALLLTGMLGANLTAVARALPVFGTTIFVAIWLGSRIFPHGSGEDAPLQLSTERRVEGRFHAFLMGLLLALDQLRMVVFDPAATNETVTSVLVFPLLAVSGLLLVRIGHLLGRHVVNNAEPGESTGYRNRLIGLLGRGAILIGFIGPLLAAVGYVSASAALLYPAMNSLALLGFLFVLQQFAVDLYILLNRNEDAKQALVPVLASFFLTLATLPLFALIWGARAADLTELWTKFREGFQMGETRISPTDFLYFAVLFAFGFVLTRLFQGTLKSTILPKTNLDQGGQNAIVAGVGYLGVFLAAVVAINAVGIDLSGLAIVAGALSVGIGFGLQNIVSNFVSGIILLIERPVSEGDWIEVGTVAGTVKAISVRSTRIQTFDRSDVIVPNADLVSQRVTNWTRFNLTGRLIVPVNVVHGSDADHVEKVLREIAEAQPLSILNPPPVVALMGFTMDAISFEIRVILRDVNFNLSVRSDINHAILRRFAEEGIELAHTPRPAPAANPAANPSVDAPVDPADEPAFPPASEPAANGADGRPEAPAAAATAIQVAIAPPPLPKPSSKDIRK